MKTILYRSYTVIRNAKTTLFTNFQKQKKLSTVMLVCFLFLSCKEAQPQLVGNDFDALHTIDRENTKQFLLGAMKFCANVDYQELFGQGRDPMDFGLSGNACRKLVPAPYINPQEFYIEVMSDDNRIYKNRNDPFKLKEIRKGYAKQIDEISKNVEASNSDKVVYLTTVDWSIENYNVAQEKLKVIRKSGSSPLVKFLNLPYDFFAHSIYRYELDYPSGEAENLFDQYGDSSKNRKSINAKITYSIQMRDKDSSSQFFEIVPRKIEFYYPSNWKDKIGEVNVKS